MKTCRRSGIATQLTVLAMVGVAQSPMHAVMGVGDTSFTVIVEDLSFPQKWSVEAPMWNAEIQNTATEVQKTMEVLAQTQELNVKTQQLLERIGSPAAALGRFSPASREVKTAAGHVRDALALAPRAQTITAAKQEFFLSSVGVKTYREANRVEKDFEVLGVKRQRNSERYTLLTLKEAMNARFQRAAEAFEQVQNDERVVQENALGALANATTQSEIQAFEAQIAGSRARIELARARSDQAKAELDAFYDKLLIETDRKAEADREWTEAVIESLRARALNSYRVQTGGTAPTSGT